MMRVKRNVGQMVSSRKMCCVLRERKDSIYLLGGGQCSV